ncbi:GntR family transcriptional regulator [Vagococcus carniphilus]|uniref:GntR family transcriptional regulator n=1 Tax=Vagococcus carniphilus TaxID=218144 RepID=A0A430B877_9ENTE|nr:GntR family transcriptional regulator [Vagococcus carniphilus]
MRVINLVKTVDIVKKNIDLTTNIPLKEAIYLALRKTIILGEIGAGERINELEFSEAFNISRTPIRYALQRLLDEKLVVHQKGIGTIVKGISIKDAYEIYDIRKALDTLATIKAMELMTDEDLEEMKQLLEYGNKLNSEDRVDELLENFSDFNSFIYEKSDMLRLKSIVTKLQTYLVYFRDLAIRSSDRRDDAMAEHWLIYRGIKNKDTEQITLITHEHLDRSLQFIVKEMEEREIAYGEE